ncbi:hypothetical protein F544_9570 [Bibersteinia trehalosi USDA-ARS-USMARC-190]|uniref:Uncharacterized protein n=1 Tax=Bibersteinia trehalosi USDA-ARS-USMARC-190 TaxID=1263832 RepID=W0R611_BIBTR|nr:hypothetical protein F544_9570 [Bibersteinia trehalosi USDA-ARS-USMARC-190]
MNSVVNIYIERFIVTFFACAKKVTKETHPRKIAFLNFV